MEAEINEVVDFLKDPEKYRRLGARAPKGVLLAGAPGPGKTLLARATAGEAKVPFFSASASEFIEMIVGVGASRVRELFAEARKVAPAIIFIDEIDTIGRTRGAARSRSGVTTSANRRSIRSSPRWTAFPATRAWSSWPPPTGRMSSTPALLRPGRFDRQIVVHPPDHKGRVEILKVHTRKVPLAADVDLERLAAVDTRHDRRRPREPRQRGRAPGRASQSGRRASARSDRCAREGPTRHRAATW